MERMASPTEGQDRDRHEPPTAEDPRLQRVIQELFRANARLPGGTAGAVRHEVRTGARVGGKSHIRKAIERRRQLQQLLRRGDLSAQDRTTAQRLLDDLHVALREAGVDEPLSHPGSPYMRDVSQIPYDNVVQALMEAVPELRTDYEAECRQWGDEPPGPHVIFGDVLNPSLVALLGADRQDATLRRVFQFLEHLANHEDIHVQELVAVTVCERLGDNPKILHRAHQYMGARTRQFSDEVEVFWGRAAQRPDDTSGQTSSGEGGERPRAVARCTVPRVPLSIPTPRLARFHA